MLDPTLSDVTAVAAAYDRVPYDSCAIDFTHPARLGAVSRLRGIHGALPDRCRVLEIGCALGQNLLPLALAYPNSEFFGVDIAPLQIERAQCMARTLSLQNVQLLAADVRKLTATFPHGFDYIICHGVYSWVPSTVQRAILECCREKLSPGGVAMISFNALPGGFELQQVRQLAMLASRGEEDPQKRLAKAREFFGTILEGAPALLPGRKQRALRTFMAGADSYIEHEYFSAFNEFLEFETFDHRVREAGLRYVCDAHLPFEGSRSALAAQCGIDLAQERDLCRVEGILDTLCETGFRRALVCRDDEPTSAAWLSHAALEMSVVGWFELDSASSAPVGPGVVLRTQDRETRLLLPDAARLARAIASASPAYVPVSELGIEGATQRKIAAATLLKLALDGAIELVTAPLAVACDRPSVPKLWPWTKLCADANSRLACGTTHTPFVLTGEHRRLLSHIDGKSSIPEIEARYLADDATPAERAPVPDITGVETETPLYRFQRLLTELHRSGVIS